MIDSDRLRLAVLHETPHDIVIVKPAGLASEASRDPGADSVVSRLRRALPDEISPRLVHRLDRPSGGLMLVALSRDAAAFYGSEIAAGRWRKVYLARTAAPLDEGRRAALHGAHRAYLRERSRRVEIVRSGGKPSYLEVLAASATPGREGELHLLIRLATGRRHQIRAMLAGLGAPLVGDVTYGGPHGPFYLEHVLLEYRDFTSGEIVQRRSVIDAEHEPVARSIVDAMERAFART
jgi:23S rRNA pseudouridine1911/1915/1917 synthase